MHGLRWLRRRAGLTQTQLAESAGIAQHTISEIETGKQEPRPSTLRKIAGALGVPVAAIFEAGEEVGAVRGPLGPELAREKFAEWRASNEGARHFLDDEEYAAHLAGLDLSELQDERKEFYEEGERLRKDAAHFQREALRREGPALAKHPGDSGAIHPIEAFATELADAFAGSLEAGFTARLAQLNTRENQVIQAETQRAARDLLDAEQARA